MRKVFDKRNILSEEVIVKAVERFNIAGQILVKGKRNTIKLFNVEGNTINIKSFKIPNLLNSIIYAYFRESKAQRSFNYAQRLLKYGIGTPNPIAYFENHGIVGLQDSYYVSEHLDADLTFKDLVSFPDYPDHENILRQFTGFSFSLHQNGIEFKDHSPGNTLIKKTDAGNYGFYLVDLNRMNFGRDMGFDARMNNLKRLTPKKEMIAVMSNEYAKLYDKPENEVFEKLWHLTSEFQKGFARKKQLKKKFLFGK